MVTCAVTNPLDDPPHQPKGDHVPLGHPALAAWGSQPPEGPTELHTDSRGLGRTLFTPIVATDKSGLTKLDTLPTQAEDSRDKLWVNDQAKNKRADERWAAHTCTDTGRCQSSSAAHAVASFGHPHGTNCPCVTAALCR